MFLPNNYHNKDNDRENSFHKSIYLILYNDRYLNQKKFLHIERN